MSLDMYINGERLNITHNLAKMASHVRLYEGRKETLYDYTWNYEETNAKEIKRGAISAISPRDLSRYLLKFIEYMHKKKNILLKYDPPNKWGSYNGLLGFAENLLLLCLKYQDGKIEISK